MTANFKEMNPEALACRNGDRILKPSWQLAQEAEGKERWLNMTEEEKQAR